MQLKQCFAHKSKITLSFAAADFERDLQISMYLGRKRRVIKIPKTRAHKAYLFTHVSIPGGASKYKRLLCAFRENQDSREGCAFVFKFLYTKLLSLILSLVHI